MVKLNVEVGPRRSRKYRRPKELKSLQIKYLREILKRNKEIRRALAPMLQELKEYWSQIERPVQDGYTSDASLGDLVDIIRRGLDRVRQILGADGGLLNQLEALASRIDAATTADVASGIESISGINVLADAPRLQELAKQWTDKNTKLIKNLPEGTLSRIGQLAQSAFERGARADVLMGEIQSEFEMSDRRAALIARDQINKLRGDVRAQRHQDLGVTQFVWRTVRDSRVRESHEDLEGQVFSYESPPSVDGEVATPGYPVNCRCYDEPVIYTVEE